MGSLTKKDFKAIAKILNRSHKLDSKGYEWFEKTVLITDLCEYLATTNTQFKRDEFLSACGVSTDTSSACEVE